ncbi:MAG: DUF1848 domain-containing protein [Bacteroidales bacterium]|nr:DUF1848 domain-containing protein [Bacteroidales bacterium]
MQIWHKERITNEKGEPIEALAPLIISASRATDIPAFHSSALINAFEKGYIKRLNPFNNKTYYISLKKVRFIVFWTKNPLNIINHLNYFDNKKINYYFQYTINDYEEEKLETGLPSIEKRIEIFNKLSCQIGKEKVIWRFDPLIMFDKSFIDKLIFRINTIGENLINHTDKLVISFVDIKQYKKVYIRLKNKYGQGINDFEFTDKQKTEFAAKLKELADKWLSINPCFRMATCAENIDLKPFKIEQNKCIDDYLIKTIAADDSVLQEFFNNNKTLKDKGQRKDCHCIVSKDIGNYNTCLFNCLYCYAADKSG